MSFKSRWFSLASGLCSYDFNMALDEALLERVGIIGAPVLRFYGWKEAAASFGYSQKFSEIEQATPLRPLVRRPTGGGLVPHKSDWTYSFVVPPDHYWYELKAVESYERIHAWIRDAFALLGETTTLAPCCRKEIPGQCFVGAEKSDVLWHGRKIAGAAQRRTRSGLLIQGSIQPPNIGRARADWEAAMINVATENAGVEWTEFVMENDLAELAESLRAKKYSQADYNQTR